MTCDPADTPAPKRPDSRTLDRVAMLCDELLRRGVPAEAVQPIVDWIDEQTPPGLRRQMKR